MNEWEWGLVLSVRPCNLCIAAFRFVLLRERLNSNYLGYLGT